jgi:hypothetical protein
MINPNPTCRQCGGDKFTINTKKTNRRWSCTATCLGCRERTFMMDASLLDLLASMFPVPEPEAVTS